MSAYVYGYAATAIAFLVVDMVWLGIMVGRIYRPTLGDVLISGVNLPPAIAFYVIYPVGLLIFAVAPALRSGSLNDAILYGALFGFFTYATYNLTNFATVRNWTTQLTVVDVSWGTVLGACSAVVGFLVATHLGGAR
jgi:uncharacterized membrane protein